MAVHSVAPFASPQVLQAAPIASRATHAEGFSSALVSAANQTHARLHDAEQAAAGGLVGTVPVQEAVDKIMAAERTLSATMAIRDKVVAAYLELSRMQI